MREATKSGLDPDLVIIDRKRKQVTVLDVIIVADNADLDTEYKKKNTMVRRLKSPYG